MIKRQASECRGCLKSIKNAASPPNLQVGIEGAMQDVTH
jgi:hypothetical protein